MKRAPWLPLDANFQDDTRLIDVSANAELVYLRSLGLTKRMEEDGARWISPGHLRKLCDKLDLNDADRRAVADELETVGAWTADVEADTWVVTAWDSWNVSVTEGKARQNRGAKQGNHNRHGHPGKLDDCLVCNDDASPGGSLDVGKRPVSDSPSDRLAVGSTSLDVDVDEMEMKNSPSSSTVYPRPVDNRASDDGGVEEREQRTTTHPAVRILQPLGIVGAEPTEGERQTVGRAIERGWTTDQLVDLAHIAASKEEPRSYLQGMLTKRANTSPTAAPAANGTAPVALAPGADWLAKWAKARTMTRASGEDMIRALGEPAGRALHEIRQIARYDTEVTAKQAFRACYLEQLNQETP